MIASAASQSCFQPTMNKENNQTELGFSSSWVDTYKFSKSWQLELVGPSPRGWSIRTELKRSPKSSSLFKYLSIYAWEKSRKGKRKSYYKTVDWTVPRGHRMLQRVHASISCTGKSSQYPGPESLKGPCVSSGIKCILDRKNVSLDVP